MDRSPLLSHITETCGTYETPSPPSPDPNETNEIVPANNSMPSNEQQNWKGPSIYKVPAHITILSPKAYRPQVVSFGPYHHDKDHLRPMEEHKHRALLQFLKRSKKSHEPFFESLRKVEHELKDSYDALDQNWKACTGDRFLELMITDGCFMLEIMRTPIGGRSDYAGNDPIFSTHRLKYIKPYIRRDMLLLENQLPMLVLYHLVAVENNKEPNECINETNKLILSFYSLDKCIMNIGSDKCIMEMGRCLHVMDVFRKGLLMEPQKGDDNLKCCSLHTCIGGISRCLLHIMDVFRKCLRMETKKVQPKETEKVQPKETEKIIRSANELYKTGIQFKKSTTHSLKDISFAGGVLKLPVMTVDGTTESKFLNLMTFERLHIGTGNEITSYTNFMDNIINNEQDVALLHAQGIIQNAIGSDKAVAELFNSLCKEVTVESNSSLDAVQVNISKFYDDPSNSWWANFRHTYFRNPWTIFSFIAAILLFTLTIIQTVYTVLSYY